MSLFFNKTMKFPYSCTNPQILDLFIKKFIQNIQTNKELNPNIFPNINNEEYLLVIYKLYYDISIALSFQDWIIFQIYH